MKSFIHLIILILSFIICLTSCDSNERVIIGIQPLGEVNTEKIEVIREGLNSIYNKSIVVLPPLKLPTHSFVHIKSPRYRADSLIRYLKDIRPDSISYIIGITNQDISTTKRESTGKIKKPENKYRDWGVFGLGYRPGPSCIVSSYRLHNSKKKLTNERLQKVTAHEIGHNLGLKHCKSGENCLMKDAVESIKTVDNEEFKLCESCRNRLQ